MGNKYESTGITVEFGTSTFTANITSVGISQSREAIDATHLGSTTVMDWIAASLYDSGEVTLGIHFDPAMRPPIGANAETITITYTQASNALIKFTGFVTAWDADAPGPGQLMTGTVTIKSTSAITTATATST